MSCNSNKTIKTAEEYIDEYMKENYKTDIPEIDFLNRLKIMYMKEVRFLESLKNHKVFKFLSKSQKNEVVFSSQEDLAYKAIYKVNNIFNSIISPNPPKKAPEMKK